MMDDLSWNSWEDKVTLSMSQAMAVEKNMLGKSKPVSMMDVVKGMNLTRKQAERLSQMLFEEESPLHKIAQEHLHSYDPITISDRYQPLPISTSHVSYIGHRIGQKILAKTSNGMIYGFEIASDVVWMDMSLGKRGLVTSKIEIILQARSHFNPPRHIKLAMLPRSMQEDKSDDGVTFIPLHNGVEFSETKEDGEQIIQGWVDEFRPFGKAKSMEDWNEDSYSLNQFVRRME